MNRFSIVAILAAGLFAVASASLAENTPTPTVAPQSTPAATMATQTTPAPTVAKERTAPCAALNLNALKVTPEQKTQLEAAKAEAVKGGCNRESRKAMMKKARSILSKPEFAAFKAECVRAGFKKGGKQAKENKPATPTPSATPK